MKIIMSLVLIFLMGISNQKEITMIREDGRTEKQAQARPAVQKPPAWLGRPATRPTTQTGGGGGNGEGDKGNALSNLWQTITNRLNDSPYIAPTSMGGNAPIPNFNTPQSIAQGQQTYAQNNNIPRAVAAPTPGQFQTPAWISTIQNRLNNSPFIRPTSLGGGNAIVPNFYDPTNDGNQRNPDEQGVTTQGTPTQGVNSFIGAGGDAVVGPNGFGYTPWAPSGVNTFVGAGGQAVRGPQAYPTIGNFQSGDRNGGVVAGGGNGSGFGSSYGGNWRRGGGGGGGGGYGYDTPAWLSNDPAYMNLYSWNYKG